MCVGGTCGHLGPGDGGGGLSLGLTVQPGRAASRDRGAPDVGVRDSGPGPQQRDLRELNTGTGICSLTHTSYIPLGLQMMCCVFLFPNVQCFVDLYEMSACSFPKQWCARIRWLKPHDGLLTYLWWS